MTARNGSAAWHDSLQNGSGTVTVGAAVHEWWTLVAVCLGTFMLLLDVTISECRAAEDPGWAGSGSASCSGSLTPLRAHARSAPAELGFAGRPARATADIRHRPGDFLGGFRSCAVSPILPPLMLNLSRGVPGSAAR